MGSGFSSVLPCFNQGHRNRRRHSSTANPTHSDPIESLCEPLDETLGHSYCYVPSSNRFISPFPSDRFVSPSGSFRLSPSHEPGRIRGSGSSEQLHTGFRAISGASVSANTSNSKTVLQLEDIYDDATESSFGGGVRSSVVNANGFEGTSSFSALPLQPGPDRSGLFMSGPIERGATSGPLDPSAGAISRSNSAGVHFSAPLGGVYSKKRRRKKKKSLSWHPIFGGEKKQRPWVLPVSNFVVGAKKENIVRPDVEAMAASSGENDLQWALGKAGEDRVQLAVFEKQGWLFAGIYDGFNGPDAPEFLMANLYRAVHSELQGLFWELDEEDDNPTVPNELEQRGKVEAQVDEMASSSCPATDKEEDEMGKRMTSSSLEVVEVKERKRLWELLAEAQAEDALDLSGSDRFAFSVDDAISAGNAASVGSKRWLLLSKLKQGLSKQGISGRKLFPWKSGVEENENEEVDNVGVEKRVDKRRKRRKAGAVDHELVLKAMSNGLEATEQAFLEMTDKVLDTNPELALMGSCLLVALMRDDDVYIMNIGDSRALVAQYQVEETGASVETSERVEQRRNDVDRDVENKEPLVVDSSDSTVNNEAPLPQTKLVALQLTTDHSTSIEDEVTRIKNEHPDDNHCIVNDRVKGRLKVTRAFGAGFLKQPKLNDALLEMFRNEYIGTDPYISCTPSLRHYRLTENDQFMVLSSDGLYQYLSNVEVVSLAMEKFPDGDPAQHVIQELLVRAAKKAGMDFHELLDIPQGDRRKYHDDCTVLVIALGGSRIWKSSGKYL
ncbi:PPM-type phosphatase domain superfamily [Arabidopsis thaliana x Arabidopsis arenosa]|uniref:PPM-type phosphatase domain superfamily n=1 Tax=Arabidopsis thaliana x Arabidopsis arenosa TaxID=1240361 RepID=A0A8T2A8I8_9BRAS|nr:PPM-type phosphatase domain superfamily [Arabidopsis thaliana x Arabidopsis arenosa]